MSNVVALKKFTPTAAPVTGTKYAYESWRLLVVEAIQRKIKAGGTIGSLAEETKLCSSTISNLYYGITKRPQMDTMFTLLDYFDYNLFAEVNANLPKKMQPVLREMEPTTFHTDPFNMGSQMILDRQMVIDAILGTQPIEALHETLHLLGLGSSRASGSGKRWTWKGEKPFSRLPDAMLQSVYIHIRKVRPFSRTQMKVLASSTQSAALKAHVRDLEAK